MNFFTFLCLKIFKSDLHKRAQIMRLKISLILLLFFTATLGFAQHHGEETYEQKEEEKKAEFDPGRFIIEEVLDHYEWHIMEIGHKEISIPLPIIVYSKQRKQWFVFCASKLRHGHHYKGFFIPEEGKYKGKVVELGPDGERIRPIDISITKNVLAIWISVALLFGIFLPIAKRYKQNPISAPKGFQALIEPLIIFIRDDIAKAAIGEKYERYTPFLLTVFFFIFANNLLGLLPFFPGGANVTGNLAVTGVLAFFTFVITTFSGTKHYWKHIFWNPEVPWWLKAPLPLMPIVELIGVFTKPTVLMIRLFANILGGHIVRVTFISLIFIFGLYISYAVGYAVSIVSVALAVFVTFLELLVAFIQAYIFTFLSAIYFGMAVEE